MFDKNLLKRRIPLFMLILSIGGLRLLFEKVLHLEYGCTVSLAYITFYFFWMQNCRQRFSQKRVRQMITAIGIFVIFFDLLRVIKLDFCTYQSAFSRYIWYLYYIPIVLLPTLNFHAMIHVWRPDSAAPSRYWNFLYVPVGIMVLGVVTNDIHHFAFRFPQDMVNWEQLYTHGPLFRIVTIWVIVNIIALFSVLIKSCLNRRLYRNLWLPFMVIVVGLIYRLNYSFYDSADKILLQKMYEIPELMGLIWISVWESAVAARLLPTNSGYADFLAASSLRAGIADSEYRVVQSFGGVIRPSADQLLAAANGEAILPDGDTVLKARPVRGGWFYWTENLRELRDLNEALEDTSDYLIEENSMLQQTAQIDEERRITLHQTELYDRISERIRPWIEKLKGILETVPQDEAAFRKALERSAFIFAFLKRFSNLLLLADANGAVGVKDLWLCFRESMRTLRWAGVNCIIGEPEDFEIPGEKAAALYELFEAVTESVFNDLREVHLRLSKTDARIECEMIYISTMPQACNRISEDADVAKALQGMLFEWKPEQAGGRMFLSFGTEERQ